MVNISMSQDWLNSEELTSQKSKNYNIDNHFYPNRSRVGITGFLMDCFAGRQDDTELSQGDLESAIINKSEPKRGFFDEPITSALVSSTQIITSAVSSLTSGLTSLFSWKTKESEPKIIEMKTISSSKQELFEVVIEGERPSFTCTNEIISNQDIMATEYLHVISENNLPMTQTTTEFNGEILIETSMTNSSVESPKMSQISFGKEFFENFKEQEDSEVIDPNELWYKGPSEDYFEEDEDEDEVFSGDFSGPIYLMSSYIDFSHDSSISPRPIPKRNKKVGLKVHFEPIVELMDFAVNNDKASIKKILKEGSIKANDHDNLGYTMLHYAASHNHTDLIKYLIEKEGADVNSIDLTDWTPLHLAAIADNFKACKMLLDHGANFEYPNCDENLPADLTEDAKVKKLFADATKKKLSSKKVKAFYDWKSESPEYLNMKKGEGFKVLERRQEFWLVQNDSKQIGLVPRKFIQ